MFEVAYSERGRITKVDDILRTLRKQGVAISEDTLARAFRVFEKQSEVDYFINKDAKAFLEEQFNLWLYQYVFSGVSEWTETRIKQLQTLKDIAFKIIAFISQFENELVKIWNKPKFVLNSNYVITLDRIAEKDIALVEKLLGHKNFKAQIEEWQQWGIVDKSFKKSDVLEKNGKGKRLVKPYQYLPVDTKYFKDVELDILGLFDNLDQELNGWLIKSENYQALNTILPKFRERVTCIHIDPPYNTEASGFLYKNAYKHSSWLTMMSDRIDRGIQCLSPTGVLLCHIDENEYERLRALLEQKSFGYIGTAVWDKLNPMMGAKELAIQHEYIILAASEPRAFFVRPQSIKNILSMAASIVERHGGVTKQAKKAFRESVRRVPDLSGGERAYQYLEFDGRVYRLVAMTWPNPNPPPPQFFEPLIHPITGKPCPVPNRGWSQSPETMKELVRKGEIIFGPDETTQPQRKVYLSEEKALSSIIRDGSRGKKDLEELGLDFTYSHPVTLYETLLDAGTTKTKETISLDFFAGTGTTGHAIINLNRQDGGRRKYTLVEMAGYFDTVLLPRIKKVIFSNKWKDGKAQNGQGISHFVKYFSLEQYEDALRRAKYDDADLFDDPNRDPYHQYVFLRDLKMLEALQVDTKKNKVKVDLSKLYGGIDIAETLSNLSGKWIKRITADSVEFDDGEVVDTKNLDWKRIKPLIWW
jgi:adenine specific DNA methylase Mod